MIKNIVLTLLVAFCTIQAYSQSDTLNKRNIDEEKTGWWLTYLDTNLVVLKDSIAATHCMYNYYSGNFFHYRYGKGLGSKKYPIHFPKDESLKIGNYKLLNGDYVTKYKNGNVRSILSASNGVLIDYKVHYPEGQLKLEIIYSAECGAPKRHCIKEYKKDGSLKYDGHGFLPKSASESTFNKTISSDSTVVGKGVLDGDSYIIRVSQVSGEKNDWPVDTLKFEYGKLVSKYMEKRERFYPSPYSPSSSKIVLDSLMSFKCESNNPGGSYLLITGTVQGKIIKGTISWTSVNKSIKRTYNFEGVLN